MLCSKNESVQKKSFEHNMYKVVFPTNVFLFLHVYLFHEPLCVVDSACI